jgi:beta-phosphoglucomutase-like phosphatase (HAD superfamily)
LEYLAGSALSDEQVVQLSQRKERLYRDLCLAQGADFKLSPGAVELLDSLAAHHIPRTIATASGWENIQFFFQHLDLECWFEIDRLAYDDGTVPGKPAPHIYLRAARNLGLQPGSCVVVEDSESGLQSAHTAGVGCLIALGPAPMHTHLVRLPGVAQVVETLAQLPWQRLFLEI